MQNKDRLLTLATALTGHVSAGEDVVHDVFAMLVKDAGRLRNDDHVAGFLSVCVRNRALDWRRMRDRQNKLSTAYAACRQDDPGKDPANRAAQEEEDGNCSKPCMSFPMSFERSSVSSFGAA